MKMTIYTADACRFSFLGMRLGIMNVYSEHINLYFMYNEKGQIGL